jgi:hypothetical protein
LGGICEPATERRPTFQDAVEIWEDYRFETEEMIDLGEHVLMLAHISGRGTGSGVPIDQRIGILVASRARRPSGRSPFCPNRRPSKPWGCGS